MLLPSISYNSCQVNPNNSTLSSIRRLDNSRKWLPFATTILIIVMVLIFIWFFRGGSFKLYASAFFGLYYLTGQIWVSVILMGILQNVVFLPLRFIGLKLSTSFQSIESELDDLKTDKEQYILFNKKVQEGNPAIVFYIFNFVVNAIAFFSAGRIFLINFYSQPLNPDYLYKFIPYPNYPLRGTDFYFPFFNIDSIYSLPWGLILRGWLIIVGVMILARLVWQPFKWLLGRNLTLLKYRQGYNRLLLVLGGIAGTLFILSFIILRHIPTSFSFHWLVADLTRQNNTMNLITAVVTFLTTLSAGQAHFKYWSKQAKNLNLSAEFIKQYYRSHMRNSFKNALILGVGAYIITNQIPCAFELSVATFEVLYILSPYTFDKLLNSAAKSSPPPETPPVLTPSA